jgi:DNA-binding NarL/FixJ family response regulator
MQAVSPAFASSEIPRTSERVAIVASDGVLVRRIREALAADAMAVGDPAVDVAGLSESSAGAIAIVLTGSGAASECRTAVRSATARFPGVPVVVVAALTKSGVHRTIDAGAAGFVLESQLESTLAATIEAVRRGQLVVPGEVRRSVVRPALSYRERQILTLLVRGLTNRQIASELYLAESTVKTHLTSIFGKLGVGSRSEAAALVLDDQQELTLGTVRLVSPATTETPSA